MNNQALAFGQCFESYRLPVPMCAGRGVAAVWRPVHEQGFENKVERGSRARFSMSGLCLISVCHASDYPLWDTFVFGATWKRSSLDTRTCPLRKHADIQLMALAAPRPLQGVSQHRTQLLTVKTPSFWQLCPGNLPCPRPRWQLCGQRGFCSFAASCGSFRQLGLPYFGALIYSPYNKDPTI